jgi:hypothetical protein
MLIDQHAVQSSARVLGSDCKMDRVTLGRVFEGRFGWVVLIVPWSVSHAASANALRGTRAALV